jgi:hypothetical protein
MPWATIHSTSITGSKIKWKTTTASGHLLTWESKLTSIRWQSQSQCTTPRTSYCTSSLAGRIIPLCQTQSSRSASPHPKVTKSQGDNRLASPFP